MQYLIGGVPEVLFLALLCLAGSLPLNAVLFGAVLVQTALSIEGHNPAWLPAALIAFAAACLFPFGALVRRPRGDSSDAGWARFFGYLAIAMVAGAIGPALAAMLRSVDPALAIARAVSFLIVGIALIRNYRLTWKPDAGSLVVLAVTSLLMLALAEGVVRLSGAAPPRKAEFYLPHPEALRQHNPGFEADIPFKPGKEEEQHFHVTISPQGIRGPAVPEKKPDEFRVLLIGDSYTFGWGVNDDETIAAAMERRLEAGGRWNKVRVLNGGVGGTGPWQSLVFLNEQYLAFEPDYVILQTFVANDVADTLLRYNRYPRAFAPEWVELVNTYRYHDDWRMQLERSALQHSHLYNLIENRLAGKWFALRLANQIRFVEPLRLIPDLKPAPYAGIIEVDRVDPSSELEFGYRELSKDIGLIAACCAERNIPFSAYNIPWPVDAGLFYPMALQTPDFDFEADQGSRRMDGVFEALGLDWIPVLDRLRARRDTTGLAYPEDGHLTPEGCQWVGAVLAEHVEQRLFPAAN